MPTIIEFIKNGKDQGLTDDQILQEIIKQHPEKGRAFNEALKKKFSPTSILQEIIRQNSSPQKKEDQFKIIKEAKERIEALKKETEQKTSSIPVIEEKNQWQEENFPFSEKPKAKNQILDEFLKRKLASEGEKEEEKEEIISEKISPKNEVIKSLPRKKGFFRRFLIRLFIFVFVLGVLGGISLWLWFFVLKPPFATSCSGDSNCSQGYICKSEKCVEVPPKCLSDQDCPENLVCENEACKEKQASLVVSDPLFLMESTSALEISSLQEIKSLLTQKSQEWINADNFRRISFLDKTTKKEIGLKDFLNAMSINITDSFLQKFEDNFTFFIYSQIQGNRVGFVLKIKNYEGMETLLKVKEPTMANDFTPIFELVSGQKPLSKTGLFKDASSVKNYTGPNFRYKVLASQDLGCYYLSSNKDYFIFTTSWKSMEKLITKLGISK